MCRHLRFFEELLRVRRPSIRLGVRAYELIWHALILVVFVAVIPRLLFNNPLWDLFDLNSTIIKEFVVAYLIVLGIVEVGAWLGYPKFPVTIAAAGAGASLIFLALLMVPNAVYSRKALLALTVTYAVGLGSPVIPLRRLRRTQLIVILLFSITTVAVAGIFFLPRLRSAAGPSVHVKLVAASKHTLEMTYFDGMIKSTGRGGAIASIPDSDAYFLATAEGATYRFSWDGNDNIIVNEANLKIPLNKQEFSEDVDQSVSAESFRVADILLRKEGDSIVLYVSHHYWKRQEKCFVVRLSDHVLVSAPEAAAKTDSASGWKTVFESRPCLNVGYSRGAAFAGEQIGGNIESLPDGRLLLTVGDHQFDGWFREPDLVSDPNADYGKTLIIDPGTGRAEIFTSGHRNSQGLTVDTAGRIWSTEHGPQGGDELNLLRPGLNYGYPFHTYGTEYGSVIWPPMEAHRGPSEGEKPVFAWVPSIAISEVVAVTDPAFERWRNDLIVTSLRGQQMWRVHLEDDRVAYAEPIHVGERLRDIVTGPGEFVLWTDSNSIVRVRSVANVDDGAALFAVNCGGCHDDQEHRIGPTLGGLFGRGVATAYGYAYSPALLRLEGRWTDERLDKFIADPQSMAPGTKMGIGGIKDSASRKKIIEYLKSIL